MIGIYKITNSKGKIYIGQSVNIEIRFLKYKQLNCKRQPKLYFSLKKYGVENHIFEIIEECSIELLDEREIYWGELYNVLEEGLNLKLGKGNHSLSQETKDKISKSMLGKKKTQEHCDNLSIAKKGIPSKRKGKPDLKQRGVPKPGVSEKKKGKSNPGAGPKSGNSIINKKTNIIYNSIKECMDCEKISKRRMFLLLQQVDSCYKYINRNYWKQN